jgi:nucleoside-diphosphate-sugar epimerase
MTGSTGLLGSALLEKFIDDSEIDHFILSVRDPEKAKLKLHTVISRGFNIGKRIDFLPFVLGGNSLEVVRNKLLKFGKIDEIYHSAAIVSLTRSKQKKEELNRINVEGTNQLLELARTMEVSRFFYFSSAYSCGKSEHPVKEDIFSRPESFRNYYEETKWRAEQRVASFGSIFPVHIFRPGIISSSNLTESQTIYLYASLLKDAFKLRSSFGERIRVLADNESSLGMTSLDDLIGMVNYIRKSPKKQVYNMTNPIPWKVSSVIDSISEALGFQGGFLLDNKLTSLDMSKAEKFVYTYTLPFTPYTINNRSSWVNGNYSEAKNALHIPDRNPDFFRNNLIKFVKST